MSRPRTPSKVLELRGAFKKHPERAREDAEGNGPLNTLPPPHLPEEVAPAWTYVVKRLPKVALFDSDEIAIETAARDLAEVWAGDVDARTRLRHWLVQLGMTPAARAKIPARDPGKKKGEFDDL